MIPDFKTSCRKINLDIAKTTYDDLCSTLLKGGKAICPFCNKRLLCRSPIDYDDSFIYCGVCDYELRFPFGSYDVKVEEVRYCSAILKIKHNADSSVELTYYPRQKYRTYLAKDAHSWNSTDTAGYTLKDLLNDLNLLHLRVQAVVKTKTGTNQ